MALGPKAINHNEHLQFLVDEELSKIESIFSCLNIHFERQIHDRICQVVAEIVNSPVTGQIELVLVVAGVLVSFTVESDRICTGVCSV